MAAATALVAGALALFVAAADAVPGPANTRLGSASEYTTSILFDDLVQPLCKRSSTDACYGCFARYARMTQVPAAYEELRRCTRQYLNGTSFAECSAVIGEATGTQQPNVFCDFEKCVRKRDMLDVVEECTKPSDNSKSEAEKYIHTTSCIIEEMQRRKFLSGPRYPGVFASPKSYALYVTEDGELRPMVMYGGPSDQFSCDHSLTPMVPQPAGL